MNLAKTQQLLARLYTDGKFRGRIFTDSEAVGKECGLDHGQLEELVHLTAKQVNFFADSLVRKRLGEVRKLLPMTRKALNGAFDTLFSKYAESHCLLMPKPHQNDAIAFCAFLQKGARTDFPEAPWVLDVARFEAACLQAIAPGRCWLVRLFRYPIRDVVRELPEANRKLLPAPRPTLALWIRFRRQGRLRFLMLTVPSVRSTPSASGIVYNAKRPKQTAPRRLSKV